jgi:8-oxo-dGTP diphosphatase
MIFEKADKVCFLMRSHTGWMDGYYTLPAGKVDEGESFTDCAVREAKEEVGVDVLACDLEFVQVVHRKSDDVWVDVYFVVKKWSGELINVETHKHSELVWLSLDNPKIGPWQTDALRDYKSGSKYQQIGF